MKRLLLPAVFALPFLADPVPAQEKREQEEKLAQFLKRFPGADANKDGKLTMEEVREYRSKQSPERERPNRDRERINPTHADISYGDHEKQKFDLWLPEAGAGDGEPRPLAIFIHGGGFRGGDKRGLKGAPTPFLQKGIAFASINYRLTNEGPYPMQMHDAARCLQFIRANAENWNINPEKIACYGGSAGAGISLWLAFHDDLADPDSDDPVARQSTRILAAGTINGQSTYDLRTFREWFEVPDLEPHEALIPLYDVEKPSDWESDRVKSLMKDASSITHLTKDDPPVYMVFGRDAPVDKGTNPGVWVHHVRLGLKLREEMEKLGLQCQIKSPDHNHAEDASLEDFLISNLQAE